jgi:hypothetical protein
MFRKPITIELVGGLGNQLFGYFAGLYISQILGCDLVPYKRKPLKKESNHGSSLDSLLLPNTSVKSLTLAVRIKELARRAIHEALTSPVARKLGAKDFSGFYSSGALGADPKLHEIKEGSFVRGYFQTYKYFEYLEGRSSIRPVTLRRASTWFETMAHRILQSQPLTMHIRRGDYLNPENDFIGALSPDFFIEALEDLRLKPGLAKREVWIFSDDVSGAREEFSGLDLGPHRWIETPRLSDPAESMILLGMGAGIVISNSTFSWWAATLGGTEFVIAPAPWFRNHPEPLDLIHPNWSRHPSSWVGQ